MEQQQQQQSGGNAMTIIGIVLFIAVMTVLGYFGGRKAAAYISGKLSPNEPEQPLPGRGDGISTTDTPTTTPTQPSAEQVIKDFVDAVLPTGNSQFPLKMVTGADLHKVNPLVKDVQQYCNKHGGTNIDVDGAFGKLTQAAVLKVFKTSTISKEQYNSIIAPALGKPTV